MSHKNSPRSQLTDGWAFSGTQKGVKNARNINRTGAISLLLIWEKIICKNSGGEMQRVLLARAILNTQFTGARWTNSRVDINGQAELYQLIHRISTSLKLRGLMVSHDLHIVMADSKEVLCINQHIYSAGTPESLSNDPTFMRLWGNQTHKMWAFIRTIIITTIICTVMFVVAAPIHQNANNKEKIMFEILFPPCLRAYCFPNYRTTGCLL